MLMTREQVIDELTTIKEYFEENSGATPICIDEAIRYLKMDMEE